MTPNTWIDKAYQFMLLGRDGFWIGHDHVIMMLATVLSQNDWFPKQPSHLQLTISGCFVIFRSYLASTLIVKDATLANSAHRFMHVQ